MSAVGGDEARELKATMKHSKPSASRYGKLSRKRRNRYANALKLSSTVKDNYRFETSTSRTGHQRTSRDQRAVGFMPLEV